MAAIGRYLFLVMVLPVISACSSQYSPSPARRVLADGVVMLARPVPPVSEVPEAVIGLLPTPLVIRQGNWLSINRSDARISLMQNGVATDSATAEGIKGLKKGSYTIVHKQRKPLWHAPADYFKRRKLPVPAEGDRGRFLRGALGDFVLFIDESTPIYSGPVWTPDLGGVRVDESTLSKIYYLLPVGAAVEVQ